MTQMESGSSLQNVSVLQNLIDGISPPEFTNLFSKYILNPYIMPGTIPDHVALAMNEMGKVLYIRRLLFSETDKM